MTAGAHGLSIAAHLSGGSTLPRSVAELRRAANMSGDPTLELRDAANTPDTRICTPTMPAIREVEARVKTAGL